MLSISINFNPLFANRKLSAKRERNQQAGKAETARQRERVRSADFDGSALAQITW